MLVKLILVVVTVMSANARMEEATVTTGELRLVPFYCWLECKFNYCCSGCCSLHSPPVCGNRSFTLLVCIAPEEPVIDRPHFALMAEGLFEVDLKNMREQHAMR